MRRMLLGVAALAMLVSACELRAEISVDPDGSGIFGMVFAAGPEMRGMLEQSGLGSGDPFADLREDLADDPVTWKVEDFREGTLEGVRATATFSSPEDLRDKVVALNEDPQSDSALSEFNLERNGEGWTFRGIASDAEEELGADSGSPFRLEQLAALIKVQFRVTLPGAAAETNADEVTSGGGKTTFIWKPSLTDRGVTFIANTTAAGGSGLPIIPIAALAGVLVLGAVVALLRKPPPVPVLFEPDGRLPNHDVAAVVGAPTPGPPGEGDARQT